MKKRNYIILFLNILLSSASSDFASSDFVLLITTLVLLFVFFLEKRTFSKTLLYPLLFLLFYFFINIIFWGNANTSAYLRLSTRIFLIYISFSLVKNYWKYFEKIISFLVKIDIIFFLIQILFSNIFISFVKPINSLFNYGEFRGYNILIYNVHHTFFRPIPIFRNSGFMWEPGAFAAMIILSISILYLTEGISNKNIKKYIIYCIGLITTFSTTGFICFLVFLYIVSYPKIKNSLLNIILFIPVLFLITSYIIELPFIKQKVISRYEASQNVIYSKSTDKLVSLGRFGTLKAGLITLKKNPLTGIGMDDTRRFGNSAYNFNWTNGLVIYILKFGIIGLIIMIFNFYKSIKCISVKKMSKIEYSLFVLILLIILFSNPISIFPIYIAFQLAYLIEK